MEFYDIIIPVPISKQRFKMRGYNQSLLIAKEIAKKLSTKLNAHVLIKIEDNLAQSKLDKVGRAQNVINMYKVVNKKEIYNKSILLIDDIFTTGSTLNECSKTLINARSQKNRCIDNC